jgi:hypothetical protein
VERDIVLKPMRHGVAVKEVLRELEHVVLDERDKLYDPQNLPKPEP